MNIQTLLIILSVIGVALSIPVSTQDEDPIENIPCTWALYKQCNSSWGNEPLGTSTVNTICSAGCAMSSVAMALYSHNIKINNAATNPDTLNRWLTQNDGYVNTDLIVWDSVSALGGVKMYEYKSQSEETPSKIQGYLKECWGVIANVRGGSHWVLLTGWENNDPDTFYVNDPGFSQTTYPWDQMLKFVVYEFY